MAGRFVQVTLEGTGISSILNRERVIQISFDTEVEFERIRTSDPLYLLLGTVVIETGYVANTIIGDELITMMMQVTLLRIEGGPEIATHEFDRRFRRFLEKQAKTICSNICLGLETKSDEIVIELPYDPLCTHGPAIIPK